MSKKLSRAKRRELREQGTLDTAPRDAAERRSAERRAEAEAAAARVHAAREEMAAEEASATDDAPKPAPRRDRTVLVLLALTAAAALIFWLTQRTPTKDTKIDVHAPPPPATGSAQP